MASSIPDTIPETYKTTYELEQAYRNGWNHGHGIACHNVPTLGDKIDASVDWVGYKWVDAENIRDVHSLFCHASAENSRCYSPFEFTAKEFNEAENSDELWEAFEQGTADAIQADLAEYTDEDYGIEPEEQEEAEEYED